MTKAIVRHVYQADVLKKGTRIPRRMSIAARMQVDIADLSLSHLSAEALAEWKTLSDALGPPPGRAPATPEFRMDAMAALRSVRTLGKALSAPDVPYLLHEGRAATLRHLAEIEARSRFELARAPRPALADDQETDDMLATLQEAPTPEMMR